jgi:hypothetical protein
MGGQKGNLFYAHTVRREGVSRRDFVGNGFEFTAQGRLRTKAWGVSELRTSPNRG